MATLTMTLYEAIQKRKSYRDRLSRFNINSKVFIASYSDANKTIGGQDLEAAEKVLKGNFDSYIHLVSNIEALNRVINTANLENKVSIPGYKGGEEIRLVEAIIAYQGIDHEINAVTTIGNQINMIQKAIDEKNRKILDPEYAYNQIQKVASNDKKGERTMDVINEAVKSYQKDNTQKLFDPNGLVENRWVDKKIDELTALKDNFHSVVTKANTSIIVEVELED